MTAVLEHAAQNASSSTSSSPLRLLTLQALVRLRPILLITASEDSDASYDESKAMTISLVAPVLRPLVTALVSPAQLLTISEAGTYVISGTSENVQIVVKAGDSDKVQIVLNGVTMSGTDAAILVENAGKTSLTLADGSQNTISDSSNHSIGCRCSYL